MTSGLVLDELDLDLPATCLLVRLGLVLIVVVVLAAVGGVGVVDEAVVVGDGGLVEFVTGALVGHVWGRDVGGHGLVGLMRGWLVVGGGVLVGIGRRDGLRRDGLGGLASTKGHELVKRSREGWDELGGRAPPIRTRTGNGDEV